MYSHLVTRILGPVLMAAWPCSHPVYSAQYCVYSILTLLPVFLGPVLMAVWPCSYPVYSAQYRVYSILTLLPVFLGPALMGVWPCVRVKGASVRSA